MRKRRLIAGSISILSIFFLILDRNTAVEGMLQGLHICMTVVIPGIFPFLFLTGFMIRVLSGWDTPLLSPLGRIMGLPKGGNFLLIPAFLGGYPMGARAVSECYANKSLDYETARRLLFFCSNAGPAFFFGVLPAALNDKRQILSLWMIHIVSAIIISLLLPVKNKSTVRSPEKNEINPGEIMTSSLRGIAMICGWVLIFRILINALDQWLLWPFPAWMQILCKGLLELTNGCTDLQAISSLPLRFILAAGLTGFGGLCVAMQTASILGRLPIRPYLWGKLLQGLISMILALSLVSGHFFWAMPLCLLLTFLVRDLQNRTGNTPSYIV